MSEFTCINCSVKFVSADIYREHYKTDWHRYNLKRRVAKLPPVSAEDFQNKVLEIRNAEANLRAEQEIVLYCNACRKQFGTQKAHDNHLNSKKHKECLLRFEKEHAGEEKEVTVKCVIPQRPHPGLAAAAAGKGVLATQQNAMDDDNDDDDDDYENLEWEDVDSDEWEKVAESPLTEKDCLFCTHVSEDMVENLKHMSVVHSFFIPDAEYCIDLEGLLFYLGEKIANYFVCLWCNDRGKTFFSLDAVRKHMIDKGHCQMLHEGLALAEYTDYYDYSSSYPDDEEGMNIDEEVVPELLDGDEYELVLPSGAVIGHRSLLRYYKQRLRPNNTIMPKKSDRKLHKALGEYRVMNWTKTEQKAVALRARDIHLLNRVKAKWEMKLRCKAHKLQKHFREQVMF